MFTLKPLYVYESKRDGAEVMHAYTYGKTYSSHRNNRSVPRRTYV